MNDNYYMMEKLALYTQKERWSEAKKQRRWANARHAMAVAANSVKRSK